MKTFRIHEKLFKAEPLFFVGSKEELHQYLKRSFKIDADLEWIENATGAVMTFPDDGIYYLVWLEKFDKTPTSYGVLAHELLHLVTRICDRKGVSITPPYKEGVGVIDETAAYMIDFFTTEFLIRWNK